MNNKTTPKDFFLHLGAAIALYSSLGAFINLAFSIVDKLFPDTLNNYFYASSIAWPISMLVVLIPVLYLLEWLIRRDFATMPEKRELWVRRWRIYFTLFISGAMIVGDVIALLNTYLTGEITTRFIFKIVIMLVVFGITFAYYLLSRMSEDQGKNTLRKSLAWIGGAVIVGTIVYGFVVVGSPAKQRAIRFDSERVSDLESIQYQIIDHASRNTTLPATLKDINTSTYGFIVPNDPETEEPYSYEVIDSKNFKLCANFNYESQTSSGGKTYAYDVSGKTWNHSAGRVCFDRTIDPTRNTGKPVL